MPVQARNILSTKDLSPGMLRELSLHGHHIDCIPFIQIQFANKHDILDSLGAITDKDHFIFTSRHAVVAVAGLLKKKTNPAYCLSGATRKAIADHLHVQIIATAPDAKSLCRLINIDPRHRYIFCCGNRRMNTIPDFLNKANATREEVLCYTTTLSPVAVKKVYDDILFFSPSAVESYFIRNHSQPHQIFYCIGDTTANRLKNFTGNTIIIADEPTSKNLLAKILSTKSPTT